MTRFVLSLAAALLLLPAADAAACSCAVPSATAQYDEATHVFEGTVRAIDGAFYVVDVTHSFKGPRPPVVRIRRGENRCALTLRVGQRVLFAIRPSDHPGGAPRGAGAPETIVMGGCDWIYGAAHAIGRRLRAEAVRRQGQR